MCDNGNTPEAARYIRQARQCQSDFNRDFPHRSSELKVDRDYASGSKKPSGMPWRGQRRQAQGVDEDDAVDGANSFSSWTWNDE